MAEFRMETDSLGEVKVPINALYGAQTQRAAENFPISSLRFPRVFIQALGLIKKAAAQSNAELKLLPVGVAALIQKAAAEVADGKLDGEFVLDIFQTGSGTSTNMNANEVIAHRAVQLAGGGKSAAKSKKAAKVHPNDHVNLGQSSNDVIPTAIHVSACLAIRQTLLPGLKQLRDTFRKRAKKSDKIIKLGRTHLMDATPIRVSQELEGFASVIDQAMQRIESSMPRLCKLAIGGTAVGTGVNTHKNFAGKVAKALAKETGIPFVETDRHFSAQAWMDGAVEMSGQLKATATSLMKVADDLRWMNSGPIAGLAEIQLPSLQPGSSIMPGKVNPVICEAMMMVCAQVIGNDLAVTIGAERGNFQLNVMLPMIGYNLLESITILGAAAVVMAEKAVDGFTINTEAVTEKVERSPMLATALNPAIGYDKAAKIAKQAFAQKRRVHEVAAELTDLKPADIKRMLDPRKTTEGGLDSGVGGGGG